MPFSLIDTILASDADGFRRATQATFLDRAAQGTVDKATLGTWLANDRLYIHGYIQAMGRLLSFLELPQTINNNDNNNKTTSSTPQSLLVNWLIDALVNIRRENDFFITTAHRFDININLVVDEKTGRVLDSSKLKGLRRFETLFASVKPGHETQLGWLEGAVLFYATEKCYLEAWTWAQRRQDKEVRGGEADADGGALRTELIPNWTGDEFGAFVDGLGRIIDDAVRGEGEGEGKARGELVQRALGVWRDVLSAEEAFWPQMVDC